MNYSKLLRRTLLITLLAAISGELSVRANETLGFTLPVPLGSINTLTQGGPPNNADTFVTPFVATQVGVITNWKAQFLPGLLENGGCNFPVGIQLKVLRAVPATTQVQVIAAGAVHDPRPTLQMLPPGPCSFLIGSPGSVIEFTDPGLVVFPGDIIGLTIMSDPAVDGYFYPLATAPSTRLVLRNVAIGESIDLSDPFTGTLSNLAPALQVSLRQVPIDIKPGSFPNSINLGSGGTVPVAIFSTPTFDVTSPTTGIDPITVTLAGAAVALKGNGRPGASFQDVNGDGLLDMVVHVSTEALTLSDSDTMAVLQGKTYDGQSVVGTDTVRIVP